MATLAFHAFWVTLGVIVIASLIFLRNRKKRPNILKYVFLALSAIIFTFSVDYIFENVFKQHHRDRFNIVLGKEVQARGIGYPAQQTERDGHKEPRPREISCQSNIPIIFSAP